MNNKITVAYGDGIGPEIMEEVLRIFQAANVNLAIDVVEIGQQAFERDFKTGIPDSAWETIKNNKILLKAPITTPQGKGYKSLNVTLRKKLGLFANVRPVRSYSPVINCSHPGMDVVVVRENEEDLYTGIEYRLTRNTHQALKIITYEGCLKIIKYAFDYAVLNNRKKVTCIMKDNIMKLTDGLFHKVFDEVAKEYPEIEADQMIVDIGAAKLAVCPEQFDVVVTENLYGDILSDIVAEVSGSVGLCGSANIGRDFAMFEAIHGSAPDISGKNIANPTGLLNGAIMMLRHIGEVAAAELIGNALFVTLEQGIHTADLYDKKLSKRKVSTQEFGDAVIENLGKKPSKLKSNFKIRDNSNLKIDRKVKNNLTTERKKQLVGVDVFIDNEKDHNIDKLTQKIIKITQNESLGLQNAYYKGLKIWPGDEFKDEKSDYLRLRFVTRNMKKPKVSHKEVVSVLECLAKKKIDFVKTEHLYLYNDNLGFNVD